MCYVMLIAPLSVVNFLVILVGAYIRKTEAGKACSGDFHEGNGEQEPYLWKSGALIKNTVLLYTYLVCVIAILWFVNNVHKAAKKRWKSVSSPSQPRFIEQRKFSKAE